MSGNETERLLETPLYVLDRIHHAPTETISNENRNIDGIYWLYYDKTRGSLFVSKQLSQLVTNDTDHDLLRLTLTRKESRTVHPIDPAVKSSYSTLMYNVGTKLLWDDDWTRIWEFRISPGERCPYHMHRLEYCFTNLTESTTQALMETGEDDSMELPRHQVAGQTVFVERNSLGSHGVRNVGASLFLQFIVEFKFATTNEATMTSAHCN
ncbi:hypothetical protein IV203_004099 [Nitzschia inconspicua]|uniref:Uncharacterized protein n=1 Tax=Nitzschia inconspicua TaxID=303405 RepID=A0A9K3L2Y9_9STRA|nr:hypothetical protein IV203_004099 [Nitzschia inconspicua]